MTKLENLVYGHKKWLALVKESFGDFEMGGRLIQKNLFVSQFFVKL